MLEKSYAVKLEIVEFWSEGAETVRMLSETYKEMIPEAGHVVSNYLTQTEIENKMKPTVEDFSSPFIGIG